MQTKVKRISLGVCLFVFLFVVIGGGLPLSPGGAFLAAATGAPLLVHMLKRQRTEGSSEPGRDPHQEAAACIGLLRCKQTTLVPSSVKTSWDAKACQMCPTIIG